MFDWLNFFVVEFTGNPVVAILVTLGLYLFILMLGKVSFQMVIIYLLVTGAYFASLLLPARAVILLLFCCALGFIVWEAMKSVNRGDTG